MIHDVPPDKPGGNADEGRGFGADPGESAGVRPSPAEREGGGLDRISESRNDPKTFLGQGSGKPDEAVRFRR